MRLYDILLALAGGVALGIGFVVPPLWWTAFFGLAPLLFAISHEGYRARHVFGLGMLAGFAGYGLSFYPVFWQTLPLTWLGITQMWFAVFVVGLIWSMTVVGFSIASGVFAILVRPYLSKWFALIYVPSAWVVADWAGAWIFSFQTLGPHSLLGTDFTMGSFGYLLAESTALMQGASIGGLYALNFELAFIGTLIFLFIRSERMRGRFILAGIAAALLILCGVVYVLIPSEEVSEGASLTVAAVSTQTSDVLHPTEEQEQAAFESVRSDIGTIHGADLIVFPEGTAFLQRIYQSSGEPSPEIFASAGSKEPPVVIDSASIYEADGNLYSRTEYYDAAGNRSVFAYKKFLMPFGEQLPYFYRLVAYAMGKGQLLQDILGARGFSTKDLATPVTVRGVSIASLLCSEAMSPSFYSGEVRQGAEVLINLSSHAWFHRSYNMYIQARRVDQVRAAENRRFLVEAGNIVPSFVIDPYGRVVAASEWGSTGVLMHTVYARRDLTLYSTFGELVLILPLAALGFFALRRFAYSSQLSTGRGRPQ
ncbi:apolipoprotein N-acyltransferase [Candidatus Kaiserbacteria bacterium]|nr:apolipoprotein N-acyltransferase [Candidatus Kaiserbacteria bacterium]